MEIKGIYKKHEEERSIYNYDAIIFENYGHSHFALYETSINKIIIINVDNHIDIIDVDYSEWGTNLRLNGYSSCHIIKYIENIKDIEITIQV